MTVTAQAPAQTEILGLRGRTALVTGGSRGLGRAIVDAFAAAGMSVVTCCRNKETADELTDALRELPGEHQVVPADITDPAGVAALIATAQQHLGHVDVLVNNVGASGVAPVADLSTERWSAVIDGNLTATFLVTQAALPLMPDGGRIITISSALSLRGLAERAHYTAAKASLIGLTRSLCKELSPRRIRVNLVEPGLIDTPDKRKMPPPMQEHYKSLIALGRLGPPAEIAGAVLFLASDLAAYVNGTSITVDGGI
jgi:3-oxoacyl-[acyl-carrier protein] reductase